MSLVQTLDIGQSLGPYQLLELLAKKNRGAVFLAIDNRTRRLVVLKTGNAQNSEDLLSEKNILSSLQHESICTVLDFAEQDGVTYLVLEYISGVTLKDLIEQLCAKSEPLNLQILLYLAGQLSACLEYLHSTHDLAAGGSGGVLHGDLSGNNVMLSADHGLKLIDFGSARAISNMGRSLPPLDEATIRYASPWRIGQRVVDQRDDIFSFGLILWELSTGRRYWGELNNDQIKEELLKFEPRDPRTIRPEVDERLQKIILVCLSVEYFSGYSDAEELNAKIHELAMSADLGSPQVELAACLHRLLPFQMKQLQDRSQRVSIIQPPAAALATSAKQTGFMSWIARKRG